MWEIKKKKNWGTGIFDLRDIEPASAANEQISRVSVF
jgi:hypothetical protein